MKTMFAKTKYFPVLQRSSWILQCCDLQKISLLKYSASSYEGLSANIQPSHSHNYCSPESHDVQTLSPGRYSETPHLQTADFGFHRRKQKLGGIVRDAEALLQCRFERSRSSPIGVGIAASDSQQPYFNLLPSWFQRDSSIVAERIPQLLGSGHPVLRLKQNIDPDAEEHSLSLISNNIQWRALVIMLVAKAFGHPNNDIYQANSAYMESVDARQRTLSEIAEMMHFAFCLHRTIVVINRSATNDVTAMEEEESALHLGNKIVVLFGDLLLSRTSKGLSSLRNAKVTELMSDAISDFSESEILRRNHLDFLDSSVKGSADLFSQLAAFKNSSNNCMEAPSYDTWEKRVNLDVASLIGRACKSSMLISQQDEGAVELAHKIGRVIGLMIQAYTDLETFTLDASLHHEEVDLCSLPIVFHLQHDSPKRIPMSLVDANQLRNDILSKSTALLRTQKAITELHDEAHQLLRQVPRKSAAGQLLLDFISTLS